MEKTVYVIGHRNPDTDSVVSATAFARLQNLLGHSEYVAARAGHLSPQTDYIYKRFNVQKPLYFHDLNPRAEFYVHDSGKTVNQMESLWSAIATIEKTREPILPVIDDRGKFHCFLHYNSFAVNMLESLNPEKKIAVTTSISLIHKTLKADLLCCRDEKELFTGNIVCAVDDVDTFKKHLDHYINPDAIVITGGREQVIRYCLEKKVRALILSSGRMIKKEWITDAEQAGVSVLSSQFDTASTSMLIIYSTPVSIMADRTRQPLKKSDPVFKIRPLLQECPSGALPVINDDGSVLGIVSESDLAKDAQIELFLVDHNEKSQAIEGMDHYLLRGIIDHHRVNTVPTRYPITFLNKPVGSTSTIITGLYRENKIEIPEDVAPLLLCGILSDTLILQSATVTEIDRIEAEYLSRITGLNIQELGHDILKAGSRIGTRTPSQVVNQDMKEYSEGKLRYTVSQIEVDSPREILDRKEDFLDELEIQRRTRGALFSALLITNITTLSSDLLLSAEKKFYPAVDFPKKEDRLYFLKDIVSRKKQLIPIISEMLEGYAE